MKTQLKFGVAALLFSLLSAQLSVASTYLPLGNNPGAVDNVYEGVPFKVWGVWLDCWNTPGYAHGSPPAEYNASATWDLSPYGSARTLHIIQYCAWADNVPTGVKAGHITVHYADGTMSELDLIVGVNTAEWSYDDPYFAECGCLQHDKVAPAQSGPTVNGAGAPFYGHQFYVSVPLYETKALDHVELEIAPESYTDQENHGCAPADWFGVTIDALTLEDPAIIPDLSQIVIPAALKIVPDTLNLKSKGKWITACLGLPEGFNVADVDAESIRLNGDTPAASWWVDETAQLLVVEFPREAVTGNYPVGDEAPLTVTGMVGGVAEFAGTDVIRVIDPGKGPEYVPLPLPELTADIRGWSDGAAYAPLFPSSSQVFAGIPFEFQEQFQVDANGINHWNTVFYGGVLNSGVEATLVIPVYLRGVTRVYTLINTAFGAPGAFVGSLTFVGSKGDAYTVDLIEGFNVRDHFYGGLVDTTTDPNTNEAVWGNPGPGHAHLDMQAFELPGKFNGQVLTEIHFYSVEESWNGKPFIAAATAEVVGGAP